MGTLADMSEPIAMPPRHPFAWATISGRELPAVIIEWSKVMDANGYWLTYARVAYAVNGEAATAVLPASQVRPAP